MRFASQNEYVIPETLLPEPLPTKKMNAFPSIKTPTRNLKFTFSKQLQQHLAGRRLLLDEIPFLIDEIQSHYENGYITYEPGISNQTCTRCGNDDPKLFASFQCARCEELCTYCRKCIMMGRVSECTPLVKWTGPPIIFHTQTNPLHWEGTLSPGQQAASDEVVQAIEQNKELLVWAVCGAGKTEVLFEGIEKAIQLGHRICLCTPRTDVVLELSPRIKQAFPTTEMATLYGGSEERMKNAQLTITTTHQLLRFHQAFDTIVIDEVDAFPYSIDASLQYAVQQAQKEQSATIYLSATPSTDMQRNVQLKKLHAVTIPARYHRHPLPVPTFHWCGNWKKKLEKGRLPLQVTGWIKKHLQQGKQLFLFLPDIKKMEGIMTLLQPQFDEKIDSVHAEDPDRKEKVSQFRNGSTRLLLTTTILERGVTVPDVQVGVFGAEDPIFTESALVQIAGRAGRSAHAPNGDIRFFHYGKTTEMVRARQHILKMNNRAKEAGYIE
ncbi:DEAD/DEAH box helicase [Sutcliffiella sp. NC1]|uniref:DEAD/DEAH box helicase n=1 Tax=Sutcliffiella sp. NC1 TaxID=3004096 RepID=UPI0022DD2A27|nr:DEAD/DEAH box helicase [Sutcliffiella sp. NC1]WBL14507.1 DEAD/DEAH box helicase [Sutcliffiella sp. NC1]